MSITTLILGRSGSGKSTSISTLDPRETFIINILDKPLPFKGYKKSYLKLSSDGLTGNYYASDDYFKILRVIKLINEKRPEIKNLILDDFHYTIVNSFMARASEKGYEKFTDLARNAWATIMELSNCRDDLFCFLLWHSELDADGSYKCKTIGKMMDDKITIEGMVTVVLHTQIIDGNYKFLTQNNGTHIAKSPEKMFDEKYIPNDLAFVIEKMNFYYGN